MTAKHLSVAIIIFVLGTFVGTGQTLLVQNLPSIEAQLGINQPTPTIIAPIPTRDIVAPTVEPTATPSATPTPTIIRHRYIPVVETPTPTL